MRPLASIVDLAGFAPGTPVSVARFASGAMEEVATGAWPDGRPVVTTDRFYVASLAKQLTGAAAAVLVRDGQLDPDQPAAHYLNDLPRWASGITPRHLAHHIAGLPAAGVLEACDSSDWTEEFALAALAAQSGLSATPGAVHTYSNIGYILLARMVERISGVPFATLVASRLLLPLGIEGMGFATGITAFPQASLLGPSLPLTHGDGGLWSTSRGFAHWLHRQNQDPLRIAHIVETPGRLLSGREVPYGWGLGLRTHCDHKLLMHGGEWTGAVAKAVRCPALGVAVVAIAANAPFATLDRLVETVLNDAT